MRRHLLPLILIALLHSVAFAQSSDEKVFQRQSLKRIQKTIGNLGGKGYVPVDVSVDSNGRKSTFSAKLVRPEKPLMFEAEFDLSDKQFEKLFQKNRAKKFRLIANEEYELKKKNYHACIWHFDPTMTVLVEAETKKGANKPKSQRLPITWKPDSRIPSVGTQGGVFEAMEKKTLDFMRANQIPGLSIALVVKGRPVYEAAFGYADIDRKAKAKPSDAFRIGWLSRLITTVAVLQLVDKGKLKLDQPAFPLLDIKPWRESGMDPRLDKITVMQLLQETGGHDPELGMEPAFNPRTIQEIMKLKSTPTPEQLIQYMISKPLAYEPGTKRASSAYSFFVLARVIEKISGMDYEHYVLANIKKPLKVNSLAMQESDPDKRPEDSVRHYSRSGNFVTKLVGKDLGSWVQLTGGGYDFRLMDGSHSWTASPADLLTIGRAIQAEPSPLLSRNAKKALVRMPQYKRDQSKSDKNSSWRAMGGMQVQKTSSGMDFWSITRGTFSSASLYCFANGNARCFTINCSETIGGRAPDTAFLPIIKKGLLDTIKAMK